MVSKRMSSSEKRKFIDEKSNSNICILDYSKYNMPKKLFRYRKISDNSLNELNEEYVWCGLASNLNDPFECNVAIDSKRISMLNSILHPENKEVLSKLHGNYKSRILMELQTEEGIMESISKEWVNNNKNSSFICSFSEEMNNLLMWSHYTDSHKGMCIEYSMEDIIKSTHCIFPVVYDVEMPSIVNIGKDLKEGSNNGLIRQLTTKSIEWKYENEWRIISPNEIKKCKIIVKNGHAIGRELPLKACRIYLGCMVSEDDRMKVNSIAKDKEILVYETRMSKTMYKVEVDDK